MPDSLPASLDRIDLLSAALYVRGLAVALVEWIQESDSLFMMHP